MRVSVGRAARKFQPKPAFHASAHLQRTLGDYRFARVLLERADDALLYEFTHATDPQRRIWVAWSPTGGGRNGTLTLPQFHGVIERAEKMPLRADENVTLTLPPNAREIPISESPVYLFLRAG